MSPNPETVTTPPPTHHMIHPGPVASERIVWARGHHKRVEATAQGGQSLRDAIIDVARSNGLSSGTGQFADCSLAATRFTTGGPARDGKAANYTFIRDFGQSDLPWGTFTFGMTPDGDPFVHCHAAIDLPKTSSRIGGHLFPPDCMVSDGFELLLDGISGVSLVQRGDAETLHSVFEIEDKACSEGDAMFVRVRPNMDVTTAIETACNAAGLARANICPSIGSLNAPSIINEHGKRRQMTSVGMEVLCFSGTVTDGQAVVQATLVDEAGAIHQGQLAAGHAPVCVTAELMLMVG